MACLLQTESVHNVSRRSATPVYGVGTLNVAITINVPKSMGPVPYNRALLIHTTSPTLET